MGYMKSLDLDAQEALEAAVAALHTGPPMPRDIELLRRLENLGWIPPTTARAARIDLELYFEEGDHFDDPEQVRRALVLLGGA